ncbi:MAG TPA: response regulator transcription factor [Nitrospiria bacterium]
MVSLILAEDHPVVRKGLRALLEGEPDFRIAGEAADGLGAVRLIEQEKPDILIVDLRKGFSVSRMRMP